MAEQVVALDLGVTWDPNAPEALLLSDDIGRTALALNPHHDDQDKRCVVLVWSGVHSARMGDPNDEAFSGHPLYGSGLSDVLWAGVVRDSAEVVALEARNRVHADHDASRYETLAHHVLLLKECVVEVIAERVTVDRLEGTTFDALRAVITR
jgi:hypothetical protein